MSQNQSKSWSIEMEGRMAYLLKRLSRAFFRLSQFLSPIQLALFRPFNLGDPMQLSHIAPNAQRGRQDPPRKD